jgi:hypothetical protein
LKGKIWMALIALLLFSVIHQNNKTTMAFSVFVTIFKLHLFNYTLFNQVCTFPKLQVVHINNGACSIVTNLSEKSIHKLAFILPHLIVVYVKLHLL